MEDGHDEGRDWPMVETDSGPNGEEEPTGGTVNGTLRRGETPSPACHRQRGGRPLRRGEREEREGEDIFGERGH